MMRELHVGYKELRGARIRVSPDGRRALLLGNQGSIFLLELSTRTSHISWRLRSWMVVSTTMTRVTLLEVEVVGRWENRGQSHCGVRPSEEFGASELLGQGSVRSGSTGGEWKLHGDWVREEGGNER